MADPVRARTDSNLLRASDQGRAGIGGHIAGSDRFGPDVVGAAGRYRAQGELVGIGIIGFSKFRLSADQVFTVERNLKRAADDVNFLGTTDFEPGTGCEHGGKGEKGIEVQGTKHRIFS